MARDGSKARAARSPTSPPPAGSARGRTAALTALVVLFLAAAVPVGRSLGANAEEVVGLLYHAPERLYPADVQVPESERAGGPGLRTSDKWPVWGLVDHDREFHPLMIDSHVGAISFYPARWLAALGGLSAARLQSNLLGVLAILAIYFLAARIAGARIAMLAAVCAATSAQFAVLHALLRPDVQLSGLAAVAAVLAWCRFAERGTTRWLVAGAALFGLAVAAKNTALWTLVAAAGAAGWFRLIPRARPGQWALAAAAFLIPLLPEIGYLLLRDPSRALGSRVGMIPAPWHSLAPAWLAGQLQHFAETLGHSGTAFGGLFSGHPDQAPLFYGAGYLLLGAVLLAIAAAFSRAATVPVRAFAAGLGILLLEHLTFYYRGRSFFLLLAPWIPIGVALAASGLWSSARELARPAIRRVATGLLVAAGLLILANNGIELLRLRAAAARPGAALFDRGVQQAAADYLVDHQIERPYVTTYGGTGVFELLSDGAVRPRYLFPFFAEVDRGGPEDYRAAWGRILADLPPGIHVVVLVPNPSPVDTSPCQHGEWIASELGPAVEAVGGSANTRASYRSADGQPILDIVEVWLPETRNARAGSDHSEIGW